MQTNRHRQLEDPRPRVRREAGSAYIVALLVLFVLTLLGLSLTLVTQTEVRIGANERTITNVFYGADTGVALATARALVSADHSAQDFVFTDDGQDLQTGTLAMATRVEVSPFYPILDVPCNLCEINNAGSYSGRDFRKVNHAVSSRAQRFATTDAGASRTPLGEKALTTMIEVQPWRVPTQAYDPIDQPSELAKIKF